MMEDISKYLDNLFAQLPNTPEARHAREELGQMMEDRYAELRAKGMGEKDAASAAIAEFGSLEEVRESLGLGAQPAATQPETPQPVATSAQAAQPAPLRPQGASGPVPPHVEQPPQPGVAGSDKRHNRGRHVLLVRASLRRQSVPRSLRGTGSLPAYTMCSAGTRPSARSRLRARRARWRRT
jgi:hypothetical protein